MFPQAPCPGLFRKKLAGPSPDFPKKLRIPVILQVLFGIPEAVGKKRIGMMHVSVKLQVPASFGRPDGCRRIPENSLKTRNIFGFKGHLYDSRKHLLEIDEYGIPIVQAQEGRSPPNRVQVAFVNSEFHIPGGIEKRQQVARAPALCPVQVKIDKPAVPVVDGG